MNILLNQVINKIKIAKNSGELKTIQSEGRFLRDEDGIEFIVMVKHPAVTASKPMNLTFYANKEIFDPFMPPYEPDLHISEWKSNKYPEYALLLNKFNVLNNHVLIVPTHFESQFSPLTPSCLHVMHEVVTEMDGFGFYNAGREAGPSQLHRHMQVVSRQNNIFPFYDQITLNARNTNGPFSIDKYRFQHSICQIPAVDPSDSTIFHSYNLCLKQFCIPKAPVEKVVTSTPEHMKEEVIPHNVLMGSTWIMVVPRTLAEYKDIPGNGLNFIGSFFVKNEESFQTVKNIGPMNVQIHLGKPKTTGLL